MLQSIVLGGLDLMGTDSDGVSWGVSSLDGWGSPATTVAPMQRARQDGAWVGSAYLKPRSIAIAGDTAVPDPSLLQSAIDRLVSAAGSGDTALSVVDAGVPRRTTVRRDGEVAVSLVPSRDVYFTWSVQLVAVDPRKFGSDLSASTGLPSTTGGLTIPFTIPFTINAVTVTGQVSLTNPGNASGPVRLRIDGPVTAPVVTHVNSGRSLVFASSLVLGAGEFVAVDMEAHSVLAQGQASRAGWVTSRGWSSFDSGPNTWAFAAGVSSAAQLTVTATPAWD